MQNSMNFCALDDVIRWQGYSSPILDHHHVMGGGFSLDSEKAFFSKEAHHFDILFFFPWILCCYVPFCIVVVV